MSLYQELLNQFQQLRQQQLPPELQAILGTDFSGYTAGSLTPEQTQEINRIEGLIDQYQKSDIGVESQAGARARVLRTRAAKLSNLARKARLSGDRRAEARYRQKAAKLSAASRKFDSLYRDLAKFKPGQEQLAGILQQLSSFNTGGAVTTNPSPNPNPGGGTGGGSGGTGGGGGGGSGNTGGGGGQVTIPGGGGGGTTPPVTDPGNSSATQVITQPGTAGNTLNDLLSQFGPDSVIANFNDSANRIRERVGGLANAQRQGITNDALGRGVGAAGFTQQRLDQSGRDELGAYGQALSQLANDFEGRRIAAGGVAGDIGGKLLQGEQFNRQINLDKLTGDRNFQLGKATINNNNLNALLQALLGQIG